jgi:hypothetical protein
VFLAKGVLIMSVRVNLRFRRVTYENVSAGYYYRISEQEQCHPVLLPGCGSNHEVRPRQRKPVSFMAWQLPMSLGAPTVFSSSSSFSFSSLGSLSLVLPPLHLTTLTRHRTSCAFELLLDFAFTFLDYPLLFFFSFSFFPRRSKCQLLVPSRPTPT